MLSIHFDILLTVPDKKPECNEKKLLYGKCGRNYIFILSERNQNSNQSIEELIIEKLTFTEYLVEETFFRY